MRERSPLFWILLMLVIGGVGLALDKGFTDDTPPYEEPPIASFGLLLFFLCSFAFVILCTVALVRLWRGPASVALTPPVTERSLGVTIVLALVVFAATQVFYWEDVDVSAGVNALVVLLSVASAVTLLVLTARIIRDRPPSSRAA